ncbi:MAG: hypothetical protein WBY53_16840 [Acidobacteriaceae bacterium]
MGLFAIPEISPLSITRAEEPVLEPPLPVARPENSVSDGETAGESYSPNESANSDADRSDPNSNLPSPDSTQAESSSPDPPAADHISVFA